MDNVPFHEQQDGLHKRPGTGSGPAWALLSSANQPSIRAKTRSRPPVRLSLQAPTPVEVTHFVFTPNPTTMALVRRGLSRRAQRLTRAPAGPGSCTVAPSAGSAARQPRGRPHKRCTAFRLGPPPPTLFPFCPPAAQSLKVTATFGGKTKVRGGAEGLLGPLPPRRTRAKGGNRAAHPACLLTGLVLVPFPLLCRPAPRPAPRQAPAIGWSGAVHMPPLASAGTLQSGDQPAAARGSPRLPACPVMLVPVLLLLLLQKGTQKQATTKKAAPKKSSSGASQWVSSNLGPGWMDMATS